VNDLLDELDAADLHRMRRSVPSLEDIVFDGSHLLPYSSIVRVMDAVWIFG
jgi:hypothetical protein